MTKLVIPHPEAETDIRSAFAWYEKQRQGLGNEFVIDLDSQLAEIRAHPTRFATVLGDVRRTKLLRFPYVIYYRDLSDCLELIAVLHASRRPGLWQERIDT